MAKQQRNAWNQVVELIKADMDPESFRRYFQDVKVEAWDDSHAVLRFPSEQTCEWVESEFRGFVEDKVSQATGTELELRFVVAPSSKKKSSPKSVSKKAEPAETPSVIGTRLNPKYTFDTFVIGEENKLAHAYARAVAKNPAGVDDKKPEGDYNPFFLHGGVGLGKTHLVHAIGHAIRAQHPHLRIVYLSAEEFVNEYIEAIRSGSRAQFQNRYRSQADVLLIDDIHFLAGKEGTQEEFFHTFNALQNNGKHIVITSDRPPRDIPVTDRLKTRFAGGLVTEMYPPGLETREAILRLKCEQEGEMPSPEVLRYIATNIRSNVRELEGALIKMLAHHKVTGEPITIELAKRMLSDMVSYAQYEISIDRILRCVAERYRVRTQDLLGSRRTRTIALPRRIAMYLSRELTNHSFPEIGAHFGGKDHSTVIHACRKVEKEIHDSEEFAKSMQSLCTALRQGEE